MNNEKIYKTSENELTVETTETKKINKIDLLREKDSLTKRMLEIEWLLGQCSTLQIKTTQ